MINSVGNKTNQNDLYKELSNKTRSVSTENKVDNLHTKLSELDKLQNKEVVNFLKKINEEITKAEFIATKVIKGEDVSKQEQNFINKKHPYVKKIIEETINEHSELKNKMDECKSNYEKELIIQNRIKSIHNLKDETIYSKLKVKLNMIIIEDAKLYNQSVEKKYNKGNEEIENLLKKMINGKELLSNEKDLINKKYYKLNPIIKKYLNEISNLRENLQKNKSKEQIQFITSRSIDCIDKLKNEYLEVYLTEVNNNGCENSTNIECNIVDGNLDEILKKISLITINEIKNEAKKYKEKDNLNNFYMNVYSNLQNIFSKSSNILILIIIIVSTAILFI